MSAEEIDKSLLKSLLQEKFKYNQKQIEYLNVGENILTNFRKLITDQINCIETNQRFIIPQLMECIRKEENSKNKLLIESSSTDKPHEEIIIPSSINSNNILDKTMNIKEFF
ncbi:unnamed protein product [Gordionus sp. m RMFG-2023]